MLVWGQPAQPLRDPARPEPLHPAVQLVHELPDRGAAPVAGVVELPLEQAEEPLGAGVVAAHALARHAAGQAVGLAYRDPTRPAVVPAPVAVHRRGLARRERRARVLEARVRELRGRAQAPRPADRPAVEAVDHRAQVDLRAGGVRHLGDVGDPQLVGAVGREAVRAVGAQREVGRRGRRLAGVAAPPAAAPPPGRQPELAHHAAHDLLGHADPLAAQLGPHGAVAAPAAPLERLPDGAADALVAVAALAREVVVVGAPGDVKETGNRRRRQTGGLPQSPGEPAPAPHRGRKGVRACPF